MQEINYRTPPSQAIERKVIPGLKLGETRLGCKVSGPARLCQFSSADLTSFVQLLLQNVPLSRGLLVLSPTTVTVKGSYVAALCEDAREEQLFEQTLIDRLQ